MVGSTASLIVKPKVMLNDRPVHVSMLKNTTIELKTVNYIDHLPRTRKFTNINFDESSEHVITFQVPPNLQNVQVQVTTQLQSPQTKSMKNFNASKTFSLKTQADQNQNRKDAYLQKKDGKYVVYLLGKNGEPQVNKSVNVSLKPTYHLAR